MPSFSLFSLQTSERIVVFLPDSKGCMQKRAPQLCSRSTASLLVAKKLIRDYFVCEQSYFCNHNNFANVLRHQCEADFMFKHA